MATKTYSTIVAVFRSEADARAAADELKANGFDSGDIRVTAGSSGSTAAGHEYQHHEGGVKGWFKSIFGENDDRTDDAYASNYENAVSGGNVLLTVDTNEGNVDTAADILNRHAPVDVHRDAQDASTTGTSDRGAVRSQVRNTRTKKDTVDAAADQQAIPVVREELQVGKRAILRGGVRVYSRVVEEPVEETIGLRQESVRVDRTPVNREVTDADLQRGQEKVIEVKEYAEEPVVSKQARVVEEVRVRKEASETNQTIRDTVRHTEVQVENLGRENAGAAGSVSSAAASTRAATGTGDRYDTAGQNYDQSYPNTVSDDISADFRNNYNQYYASSGEAYDTYAPAYQYGYTMANDPRYRGRKFDDVESDLRDDYGRRYPNSTWDRMKNSIRYGWDRLTNRT